MSVHALTLRMPVAEVPTVYRPRPIGSISKLNTWRDGLRIAWTLGHLFRTERPLAFFGIGFGLCQGGALASWMSWRFQASGMQMLLPDVLWCSGLVLLGFALLLCGVVLDGIALARAEAKRLVYLQTPAIGRRPSLAGKLLRRHAISVSVVTRLAWTSHDQLRLFSVGASLLAMGRWTMAWC